ncbi:hypothetical protein LJC20_03985, partial [Eubacteriales bacterium OttesenSCG-928-M02]|nr:hypothetical protein [Eubacteriales bacterium OttesenSCG-928-M02]
EWKLGKRNDRVANKIEKEMYLHLFHAITDVIDRLQQAQQETEQIYTAAEILAREKEGDA